MMPRKLNGGAERRVGLEQILASRFVEPSLLFLMTRSVASSSRPAFARFPSVYVLGRSFS